MLGIYGSKQLLHAFTRSCSWLCWGWNSLMAYLHSWVRENLHVGSWVVYGPWHGAIDSWLFGQGMMWVPSTPVHQSTSSSQSRQNTERLRIPKQVSTQTSHAGATRHWSISYTQPLAKVVVYYTWCLLELFNSQVSWDESVDISDIGMLLCNRSALLHQRHNQYTDTVLPSSSLNHTNPA